MKEMNIEKRILKGQSVDEVLDVQATSNLTYRKDNSGIHTLGPIRVQGTFRVKDELKHFEETLEMDILAPLSKLSGQPFEIKVNDVNGIADDGIMLYLDLAIEGLKEGNEEEVVSEPVDEVMDETVEEVKNEPEIECIEDLFDDANNVYTSCRLIVAKEHDSYESIAKRYDVDVNDLTRVNRNKPIEPKILVMLP